LTQTLKQKLDKFYRDYDFKGRIANDPIELPHLFTRPEDVEVSGFIAACFSYGKVELFKPVIKSLLHRMGHSPYDFLLNHNICENRELFAGLRYRFNSNDDILCLFHVLGSLIRKYGSVESVFRRHYRSSDTSIEAGLAGMTEVFLGVDTSVIYGDAAKPKGFLQFFPSPARGSACKRMNMFLRWMIRDRDIDFGIWRGFPKNKLVIPLDVHIARISRCLGFTSRASQDWKTAIEITESLKTIDAEDPLKYDFALCHQGIARICSSKRCDECNFKLGI